ncbi:MULTISPECIES: hypothetical protein [Bacillus cereus group]|uniref:hypothetical protein n=1 Tax=Bacillus cereus group TaxID=86661 RepID=UPI0020CE7CF2|nr:MULTISPECIES: hypothetical protein [Bacillus cereus group]MCP9282266.1 hypothetical protein [Bacillus wiedmannii]
MFADWMNSYFLISHSSAIHVVLTKKGFCSSSSYLIMSKKINAVTLGDWKNNKTSFTVIEVQINT